MSTSTFAPATLTYTKFEGKQCVLPCSPTPTASTTTRTCSRRPASRPRPRRWTSSMADAKKLTVRNPDGSHQGVRVPAARGLGGARPRRPRPRLGRLVVRLPRQAAVRHRAGLDEGADLAEAARRLVRLRQRRSSSSSTYTSSEFDANNAFETGKVAMVFDGEWRTRDHRRRRTPSWTTAPPRSRPTSRPPTSTAPGASAARSSASPRRPSTPTTRGTRQVHGDRHDVSGRARQRPRQRAHDDGRGELAGPASCRRSSRPSWTSGTTRSRHYSPPLTPGGSGYAAAAAAVRRQVGRRQGAGPAGGPRAARQAVDDQLALGSAP